MTPPYASYSVEGKVVALTRYMCVLNAGEGAVSATVISTAALAVPGAGSLAAAAVVFVGEGSVGLAASMYPQLSLAAGMSLWPTWCLATRSGLQAVCKDVWRRVREAGVSPILGNKILAVAGTKLIFSLVKATPLYR